MINEKQQIIKPKFHQIKIDDSVISAIISNFRLIEYSLQTKLLRK